MKEASSYSEYRDGEKGKRISMHWTMERVYPGKTHGPPSGRIVRTLALFLRGPAGYPDTEEIWGNNSCADTSPLRLEER